MTMATKTNGKRAPKVIDVILEPFVPMGYSRKTGRLRFWRTMAKYDPLRYTANNAAVVMMVLAYDLAHQGNGYWTFMHAAIAAPSLLFIYHAVTGLWEKHQKNEGG